jgi:hypothetical protein
MPDIRKSRVREGSPEAHGAIWDGNATNFGGSWRLVLNTNVTEQIEGFEEAAGDRYGVRVRSLVMFAVLAA